MSENGNGVLWAQELGQKYTSGIAHQFVLHFNVQDYTSGLASVSEYLAAMLGGRDLVVTYDISAGIKFLNPAHRKLFIKALGLDTPPGGDLAEAMGIDVEVTQKEVELPRQPGKALPLLERALHLQETTGLDGEPLFPRVAVIINWAEQLAPAGDCGHMSAADRTAIVTLARWATDNRIRASNGIIVLICRNLQDLAEPLRSSTAMIEAITVPLPDEAARLGWIEAYLVEKPDVEMEMPAEVLARATAGLSLVHIEDIFLRAAHEGRPVDRELAKDRKDEIVAQEFGDVLEIMDPQWGLDMIAGHDTVKEYLQAYVIDALTEGRHGASPLGVLFMGPAGTGKTAIVEAIAYECGFNSVKLNMAKILGGLVGSSERNMYKVLLAVESMAPCLIFTDEIDQKFGQRGGFQGDSGVSGRLFDLVMEFMSDESHRGSIVWLAATNRPDLLDAAFKRAGRFDIKVALLPPDSDEERADLFRIGLTKAGLTLKARSEKAALARVGKLAGGYTGAEIISSVVIKAGQLASRAGRAEGTVSEADLQRALEFIAPSTQDLQFMTDLALAEINDLELLPESYRQRASNKRALAEKIETQKPTRVGRGAREM